MGGTCSRTAAKNAVGPNSQLQSQVSIIDDSKKAGATSITTSILLPENKKKSASIPVPFSVDPLGPSASSPGSQMFSPKSPSKTSISSPGSSVSNVSAIFSGAWEMMSLTEYEKSIVKNMWEEIVANNPYFCEGIYYRLLQTHPSMRELFGMKVNGGRTSISEPAQHLLLRNRASEVQQFLDQLILHLNLDTERCIVYIQALGERHAGYLPAGPPKKNSKVPTPMSRDYWKHFCRAFFLEIDSTLHCSDDVEEREMQKLSWTHFLNAVIEIIRQSYEEEFWKKAQRGEDEDEGSPNSVGGWVSSSNRADES